MTGLYEDVRQVVRDGDIVFIHGSWNRPIQALIMFFTGSEFSHCAIAFWIDTPSGKRLMCVEAQGMSRRRILTLSYYDDAAMTIIPAPKPWTQVRHIALEEIGKKQYGMFEAIYVGIQEFIHRHTGRHLPRLNMKGEICSEFIAKVYDLEDRDVSPQKLYEQLIKKASEEAFK